MSLQELSELIVVWLHKFNPVKLLLLLYKSNVLLKYTVLNSLEHVVSLNRTSLAYARSK